MKPESKNIEMINATDLRPGMVFIERMDWFLYAIYDNYPFRSTIYNQFILIYKDMNILFYNFNLQLTQTKNTIMKKLLIITSLVCIAALAGAQETYTMFETMYIKPKAEKIKEFHEALAAHNKQYHAEGPSGNFIRFVSIGKHAGSYVWTMGPLTFTDLDSRPADDAHDEDWNKVMPYIDEISEVEFWRLDPDLSYIPDGYEMSEKIFIRAWDIKPGKSTEFKGFLENVVKVVRENGEDRPWTVYWNMFNTGNGRDVAGVWGFEKWAAFDEEDTFVKDYEALHGEGSWKKAMELLVKTSTITEEVRELVPELGGKTQ